MLFSPSKSRVRHSQGQKGTLDPPLPSPLAAVGNSPINVGIYVMSVVWIVGCLKCN